MDFTAKTNKYVKINCHLRTFIAIPKVSSNSALLTAAETFTFGSAKLSDVEVKVEKRQQNHNSFHDTMYNII